MNKKSNNEYKTSVEIKSSIDYSLYGLLSATIELCKKITLEKIKGKSHIELSTIDYHYDNMINDCSYFIQNIDKLIEVCKKFNNLVGNLID